MKSDRRMGKPVSFNDEVYRVTLQIPAGKVSTYGTIASALRREGASRAVGMALHVNPDSPRIPCHRVVCRNGRVGGYAGGVEMKTFLLMNEGVVVENGRVQNFERKIFFDFV